MKWSKNQPYYSKIIHRYPLTEKGSTKQTYHIELEIDPKEFSYKVGDSIGILPENNPITVQRILQRLDGLKDLTIKGSEVSAEELLKKQANLSRVNKKLFELCKPFLKKTLPTEVFENKKAQTDLLNQFEVIDFLEAFDIKNLSTEAFCSTLSPQLPRFYSIASSQSTHPNQIDLTVAIVEYWVGNRKKMGVTSEYLCDRAQIQETSIPIFLLPTQTFTLPSPEKHLIMIGPGTGIAPFRGFLLERAYLQATGKNWLFFGERHRKTDFYYYSFFSELSEKRLLNLSTAFSRDQEEKIYVQHRLLEGAKHVWQWIEEECVIYVCGDAKNMARSVEDAFIKIFQNEGKMSLEEAKNFLKKLRKEQRYLLDVY